MLQRFQMKIPLSILKKSNLIINRKPRIMMSQTSVGEHTLQKSSIVQLLPNLEKKVGCFWFVFFLNRASMQK